MNDKALVREDRNKYLQDTLYVLSGKWKLPILITIHEGHTRFKAIQRRVGAISAKVLTNELKELEQNKLINRLVEDSSSVMVQYTTATYCSTLSILIQEMIHSGQNHRKKVQER